MESDRSDVSALLRAEQIARAANLQVPHRDFEAAAEGGVLFDGADALAGIGQQTGMARARPGGISQRLVAANPAWQLIEVAQPKPVGSINNDRIRVRNVQPAF